MMNSNCQECDFSMESLLLRCNKTFHFCSDLFRKLNFSSKRVVLVMSSFTYSKAFCSN